MSENLTQTSPPSGYPALVDPFSVSKTITIGNVVVASFNIHSVLIPYTSKSMSQVENIFGLIRTTINSASTHSFINTVQFATQMKPESGNVILLWTQYLGLGSSPDQYLNLITQFTYNSSNPILRYISTGVQDLSLIEGPPSALRASSPLPANNTLTSTGE